MPLDDGSPAPLSPAEAAELRRRQRGRNIALLVVLVAVVQPASLAAQGPQP